MIPSITDAVVDQIVASRRPLMGQDAKDSMFVQVLLVVLLGDPFFI